MFVKIMIAVAIIVAGILITAGLQSPDYLITRTISINATPETIFPHLNSAQKSYDWMPWKAMDSQIQMNFSGPEEGPGSKASWSSPGEMGTGNSVVTESNFNKNVKVDIEYEKPVQMTQKSEFSMQPSANGTLVAWSVTGTNSFIGRVVCLFMNMDKMVGENFEKGLANLKTKIEAAK